MFFTPHAACFGLIQIRGREKKKKVGGGGEVRRGPNIIWITSSLIPSGPRQFPGESKSPCAMAFSFDPFAAVVVLQDEIWNMNECLLP